MQRCRRLAPPLLLDMNRMARLAPWPLWLIVLATAAAYAPTLRNGFVWDDKLIVLLVPAYRNFDLTAILTSAVNTLEYLPLRDLTLAVDFLLWGERPVGFHLSSLLIHLATVVLAYGVAHDVAERTNNNDEARRFALIVALIMGLHPLHVEPVSFVSTRNTLLAMLLTLSATRLYLRAWRRDERFSTAATAMMALACLSKASAVFLPFALAFLVPVLARPGERRRGLILIIPLALVALAATVLHLAVGRASGVLATGGMATAFDAPILFVSKIFLIPGFYASKFFFPWPLAIAYPNEVVFSPAAVVRSVVAGLALTVIMVLVRRGTNLRLPIAGLLWFLAALLPVLNLAGNATLVADRYAYAANFGLAVILAAGTCALLRRFPRAAAATLLIPCLWGAVVIWRGADWHDDFSLRASSYQSYPAAGRFLYANVLAQAGRDAEALELYREAPKDPLRHYFAGRIALRQGKLAIAATEFGELQLRTGDSGMVLDALAETYERMGNDFDALALYRRIATLPAATSNLGAYRRRADAGRERIGRRMQPAIVELAAIAEADPDNYEAHFVLAVKLQTLGRYTEAVERYQQAAAIAPTRWEPWYNLALMHAVKEDFAAARAAIDLALARAPWIAAAHLRRGLYLIRLNEVGLAEGSFRKALAIDPSLIEAAWQLFRLARDAGQTGAARDWLLHIRRYLPETGVERERVDFALNELAVDSAR